MLPNPENLRKSGMAVCKVFVAHGLGGFCSGSVFEGSSVQLELKAEAPGSPGAFFCFCFYSSGWSKTAMPVWRSLF